MMLTGGHINRRIWIKLTIVVVLLVSLTTSCGGNVGTGQSATELHLAVEKGDLEGLKVLLSSGADVNATDDRGRTPLHIAAGYNDVEMIVLLCDSGANLHVRDNDNFSPRALAGAYGMTNAEELLRELEG